MSLKIEIYRFSLFYFVFEDNFLVQAPWRAYIWGGGRFNGRLFALGGLYMEGLIFGILRYPVFTYQTLSSDAKWRKSNENETL